MASQPTPLPEIARHMIRAYQPYILIRDMFCSTLRKSPNVPIMMMMTMMIMMVMVLMITGRLDRYYDVDD